MADLTSYFVGFDVDSGGGTEYILGINLRRSASGGSQELLGQTTMAASIPVAIASDQGALDVSGATVTVDSELPAAAALGDDTANPTVPGVGAFGMVWDGATWDRMAGTSANGVKVDITQSVALDVSGATVTVDSELPAAAALADDTANPTVPGVGGFMLGYDSGNTNWNRVEVDDAGHLQVDVLSGGGASVPTNPVTDGTNGTTPVNIGEGLEGNLDSPEAASKKLVQVTVWSSVAFRARLYTVDNGVESTDPLAVGGAPAHGVWVYNTPHRDYVTLGSTAGLDAFRVECKNLDDNNDADFYAVFHYED